MSEPSERDLNRAQSPSANAPDGASAGTTGVDRRVLLGALAATTTVPDVAAASAPRRRVDVDRLGFADLQRRYTSGDLTSEEVIGASLERIKSIDGSLHAVGWLNPAALDDARASDARRRRGRSLGPLDGAPIGIKATYDVAGTPTNGANSDWARLFTAPATVESIEVERLRAAGAVIVGKTNADDFAEDGLGAGSLYGQVRSPWDPDRQTISGGSSAGTSVAAACGLIVAGTGTDDGGSNRIPAAFVAITGLKTTWGLVPRAGVIPSWPYIDCHGPLARSAADCAAFLDVVAGPDASDFATAHCPSATPRVGGLDGASLKGARFGIIAPHLYPGAIDPVIATSFTEAVERLRGAGAVVETCDPPVNGGNVRRLLTEGPPPSNGVKPLAYDPAATFNALFRYFERQGGDAEARFWAGLPAYATYYTSLPRDRATIVSGMKTPYEHSPASLSFLERRIELRDQLTGFMDDGRYDALIYPSLYFQALRIGAKWPELRSGLSLADLLGLPEISTPIRLTPEGQPGGNLSILGRAFTDGPLLNYAHAFSLTGSEIKGPPVTAEGPRFA
jgi:aspartyl-tRNA(Asn)/glutamyl-tRNA(Gln) amidotransferase subunit A